VTGTAAVWHPAAAASVEIACPACGAGRIVFAPQALAAGAAFACDACGACLSLAPDAQRLYAESLRQLDALRQRAPG
jgi:predicted RNA-binding Zn-ribbon protein involved in translation (DUF1610 family)